MLCEYGESCTSTTCGGYRECLADCFMTDTRLKCPSANELVSANVELKIVTLLVLALLLQHCQGVGFVTCGRLALTGLLRTRGLPWAQWLLQLPPRLHGSGLQPVRPELLARACYPSMRISTRQFCVVLRWCSQRERSWRGLWRSQLFSMQRTGVQVQSCTFKFTRPEP